MDSAGGSSAFAISTEKELQLTFGSAAYALSKTLLSDNPVYKLPGFEIKSIAYREYANYVPRASPKAQPESDPEKWKVEVYYSQEDLSAGLVGEPMDGIVGYEPKTAADLMRNIILSATQSKGPTTRPM